MVTIARKISIRKPVALLPFGKKTGRRLFPSVVDSGFDLRLLAAQAAKIEQFRSSDFTSADNINCLYVGRMDGPCLLNTDAVGDLPDGESSPGAAALDLDDSTFEDLYSLSGTFLDAVVNSAFSCSFSSSLMISKFIMISFPRRTFLPAPLRKSV